MRFGHRLLWVSLIPYLIIETPLFWMAEQMDRLFGKRTRLDDYRAKDKVIHYRENHTCPNCKTPISYFYVREFVPPLHRDGEEIKQDISFMCVGCGLIRRDGKTSATGGAQVQVDYQLAAV